MDAICCFLPPKQHSSDLVFIHFVYETGIKRLRQPFIRTDYYLHLVFKGTANLKIEGRCIPLKRGDIFFTFPHQCCEIEYSDDFTFLYISFNGNSAQGLLKSLHISKDNCYFSDFEKVIDFWMTSIRRVTPVNANTLTECVLMYTLSYIDNSPEAEQGRRQDKFDSIIEYINHNFTSSDISLKRIADIFFYTTKHLSFLFSKRMGIKFTQYLNDLRINYAIKLMKTTDLSITDIAFKCGYSDRIYFSKVFKRVSGMTPKEFRDTSV